MAQVQLSGIPGLSECRQCTRGDPEICVAVVDSRVDLSHPSFAGADLREVMPVWLQSRMRPVGASHGTHVASVIFGQLGGRLQGIAPRCRGILIPVYGENESGELMPCGQDDLARAVALALEAGAHLINISGGELIKAEEVDPFLEQAIRSCERQDVVVIAATGNNGCECLHAPALLSGVLAVGAADASGQPLAFSNWDETLASHGILAPGQDILGAVPGGDVAAHSGTSFACPVATGVAALLLSLQKLRGLKPTPTAVRDAIIASAIPCGPQEQAQCDRMLGGRLNVTGAYQILFDGQAVNASENEPHGPMSANAIRGPPAGVAPSASCRPSGGYFIGTCKSEGAAMSEHLQSHSRGWPTVNHGVAPQMVDAAMLPGEHTPSRPMDVSASAAAAAPPTAAPLIAAAVPPAAVLPQAAPSGCSCGCGQSSQAMPTSQGVGESGAAQQDAGPMQYAGTVANHGGVPMQAPYGTHPALSPRQRTAMLAGYPSSGAGQQLSMPVSRGVAPSQHQLSGCPCPMPNDFIWAENSQLVYVVGTLGYDFITDARRDYFVQQFENLSNDHDYVSLFKQSLGLQPGPIYFPEDHRFMAAYLNQGLYVSIPPDFHGGGDHFREAVNDARARAFDIGSLVWVLFQENQPLYALRPLQTFAPQVLEEFANFLFNQSRPDNVLDADGKEADPKKSNALRADRVSIAGRIVGDITLYNGQRVPVLDVSSRALFQWTIELLVTDLADTHPEVLDVDSSFHKELRNLLDRIYYEVRNMGQAPSDRAINFMATQILEASNAVFEALQTGKFLDSIYAEKSPLCRPRSQCFDVVMRFFDPANRLERALDEYRLTVDVVDIAPVAIGKTRRWARFA
jgi:cyanobactin maturation PatA/PatG family protease